MNLLQALAYFASEALSNLLRGWRISSLAVATTALSLFIGGFVALLAGNMAGMVENWRSDAQIVIYLVDGIAAEDLAELRAELSEVPWVENVAEVGSRQAQERFRRRFPDMRGILDDLERSPFPVSMEIETKRDAGELGGWVASLRNRPGVAAVDDDAEWLASLNALAAAMGAIGLMVGGILMVAAAVSIASVVRLSTFVYRKEIAAMRLIGATEFFVRGPFVAEGVLQGLAGACLALAALWLGYWTLGQLELPWLLRSVQLGFLSGAQAATLIIVGAAAGLVGGLIPLRDRAGVFG